MDSKLGPMPKFLTLIIGVIILIFVFQWVSSPLVVTISGVGEVTAPAEFATVTLSVTGTGDTASAASDNLNGKISRIKETLKTSGVRDSDIYESQAAIYPTSAIQGGQTGYTAISNIGYKTTQIENLSGVTSTLYTLGAAVVTQPVLSVGDTVDLDSQAYDLALKDAKNKAGKMAIKNLKFIRKIVLIEQSQTNPTSTVTTKPDVTNQIDNNLPADSGIIKVSKVISVSYKMW